VCRRFQLALAKYKSADLAALAGLTHNSVCVESWLPEGAVKLTRWRPYKWVGMAEAHNDEEVQGSNRRCPLTPWKRSNEGDKGGEHGDQWSWLRQALGMGKWAMDACWAAAANTNGGGRLPRGS